MGSNLIVNFANDNDEQSQPDDPVIHHIKRYTAVGGGILIKLVIILFCAILSSCNIDSKKTTSVNQSDKIEYFSSDSIDTYTFKYSNESNFKGIEIVYAECDSGMLIEKESHVFELNNNSILKMVVSNTDVDIYYSMENDSEKHIQFLSSLDYTENQEISYTLKQDRELTLGDVLLYLDARDMTSIQSEVYNDWKNFEGFNARAVILRFTK
ncbi:MAG: hypothetical protein MR283_00495 [Erysipelotrichaceae bacterium]|nr:hypothetical protein [Erysipelotrichaceae bacterium]